MRLIILFISFFILGCQKKEEAATRVDITDHCDAYYDEALEDGRPYFQIQSYQVRCFGPVGISRPNCIWRLRQN